MYSTIIHVYICVTDKPDVVPVVRHSCECHMARALFEDLYFDIMERSSSQQPLTNGQYLGDNTTDVFDAIKRKFVSMSENFLMQGFLPFRRKASSNESTPDDDVSSRPRSLGAETIEMSRFSQRKELTMKGHDFFLQQLSNPTWCDECGDFIWGLYKQCLRCRCEYLFTQVLPIHIERL